MHTRFAAALAAGVIAALTGAAPAKKPAPRSDIDRAATSAVAATHGGRAVKVAREAEGGATWEVEVALKDGRRMDVLLDSRFRAIQVSSEREPVEARAGKPGSEASARWGVDANRAARAAAKAVGGGALIDLDRAAEKGATWEVEFMKLDGKKVSVFLDGGYRVVRVERGKKAN